MNLSIDDFGADPTGIANSYSALISAIAACPIGGTLDIPGTYRISAPQGVTSVRITKTLTLSGPGRRTGNIPNGTQATGVLYFDSAINAAIEIDDVAVTLDGIALIGIGHTENDGDGIWCHGISSAVLLVDGSTIQSFRRGIFVEAGDYCKIERSSVVYCRDAVYLIGCYNFNIVNSHIRPEGDASRGIVAQDNCQVNVFGGALESFEAFGWLMLSGSVINLQGVYIEGNATGQNAWNGFLGDGCAVVERASYVYMTGCARHISVEGSGTTHFKIDSCGNFFVGDTTARRVDYYSFNQAQADAQVSIRENAFIATALPGANNNWLNPDFIANYPAFTQGVGSFLVEYPLGHPKFGRSVDTRSVGISAIPSPSGGCTVDVEARQAISALLTTLKGNITTP